MNERQVFIAAAYAGIIDAVIGLLSLILEIRREGKMSPKPYVLRLLLTAIGGTVFLGVFGVVIYWVAIILATGSGGTPVDLVIRSTTYATILGIILGILWGQLILPQLTKFFTSKRGGNYVV